MMNMEVVDMESEQFLKKVRERGGLKNTDQARQAVKAVFDALRTRISHRSGDNVAAQLPLEIKQLWESGPQDHVAREMGGFERMNLQEFLDRIQNAPGVKDEVRASVVTRAVFSTMREQITEGAARSVESELPDDIRNFWQSSTPPPEPSEEGVVIQEMPYEFEAPVVPTETEPHQLEHQARPSPRAEGRYDSDMIGPSAASIYRSDEQLAGEIEELLDASDELDSAGIDVVVRQGHVTLRGSVHNRYEFEAATRIASEALGTTSVDSQLSVTEAQ